MKMWDCLKFVETWGGLFLYGQFEGNIEQSLFEFLASLKNVLVRRYRLRDVPKAILKHIVAISRLELVLPSTEMGLFMHLTMHLLEDLSYWGTRFTSMMSFERSVVLLFCFILLVVSLDTFHEVSRNAYTLRPIYLQTCVNHCR
jgi:hypothetical protein